MSSILFGIRRFDVAGEVDVIVFREHERVMPGPCVVTVAEGTCVMGPEFVAAEEKLVLLGGGLSINFQDVMRFQRVR